MSAHYVMPRGKPLIKMRAATLREAQTKTLCHPLRDVKIEASSVTLCEVREFKIADTWADKKARIEIRTVDDTLGQI